MIYDVKSFGQITEDSQGIFCIMFVVRFGTVIYAMYDGMYGRVFSSNTILMVIC